MADPFVGQIMPIAFTYAPQNYAFCNGASLPINQFTALFSLLGVQFGGNGQTTFQLPALNGRMTCGTGAGPGLTPRTQADTFGAATVTLDQTQMPGHVHGANAVAASRGTARFEMPTSTSGVTTGSGVTPYANGPVNGVMAPTAMAPAGGNQPHNNQQPFLALNYVIALNGVYPNFP